MGNLGSKNTIKIDKNDTTLIDMKGKCRELRQFNKNLESKISLQSKLIRSELEKKDKVKAIQLLKYKKTLDNMLENSTASLLNLKTLIDNIEMSQLEVKVLQSLEAGKDALIRIQSEMPIHEVERIMDDVKDAIQSQEEISNLLSENMGIIDDDDLLSELSKLEDQVIQEVKQSLPEVPVKPETEIKVELDLPDIPNKPLGTNEDKEKVKKLEEAMYA
ncbi:hypothetical protein K502DRAFT_325900 [Neoconidiobolus thromboides FSU 785]|nr:hypothetical protein K502DRAFT_325900 [Neoconidiobolus thromboides FSU 785]